MAPVVEMERCLRTEIFTYCKIYLSALKKKTTWKKFLESHLRLIPISILFFFSCHLQCENELGKINS